MRIIMSANAMWANTGYGTQCRSLLPRLRDRGHTCANFAWYGLQGGMMQLEGIQMYPVGYDIWGNDIPGQYVKHFNADLWLTLQDVWVLAEDYRDKVRPAAWAAWAPVDHEPIPPQVADRWKRADFKLSYSKRGTQLALDAGISDVIYIPHGLETATFRPGNKREARARLSLPQEAFICAMVAANKGMPARKAFSENLQAFKLFRETHPDAVIYMHSLQSTAYGGMDLPRMIHEGVGLPQGSVYWVDQLANHLGLPNAYMADVYRAADVLIAASAGEGFGLPIMEAQACGCPVITTNWTAMPELTVNGICTEPAQRVWSPLNSWAAVVSVLGVANALERVYDWSTEERRQNAEAGIQTMRAEYDWDLCVTRYWQPFLAEAERIRRTWPSPT